MSGAGLLYIYNMTPVEITAVTIAQGASVGAVPGMQGQTVAAPLQADRGPLVGNGAEVVVTFSGGHSCAGAIALSSTLSPAEGVQLLCAWNGFLCTDQYGRILQFVW